MTSQIVYMPVLHNGYLKFFRKYPDAEKLFILGQEFIDEFSAVKDIRQVFPEDMVRVVDGLRIFKRVKILGKNNLFELNNEKLIIANDEICRKFAEKYLKNQILVFDDIFLRWDEKSVFSKSEVKFDRISSEGIDRRRMRLVKEESDLTSDWWRQVGCVLIKDSLVIYKTHNRHLPSEHTPYEVGDPRDFIKAGQNSELASALHCEQAAIAWAANEGISLKGTSLYVTVFPCPVCAKLVAFSGISKLYYLSGHASLDGVETLKNREVEIILVK